MNRVQQMKSICKIFLNRKNKVLSMIIGYVIWAHVSVCFARNGAVEDAAQAVNIINQTNQGSVSTPDKVDIKISNNHISVNLNNVPMRQVLEKLSTQTGIKTWISDSVKPKNITARFEMLPMDESLRRLLRDSSYLLVHDNKGDTATVISVYVLPFREGESNKTELRLGDSGNMQGEVLAKAIKSNSIPDDIKRAMVDQFRDMTDLQNTVSAQRNQSINKLIELVEKVGAADPKTISRLRTKYELQRGKQTE